MLHDDAQNAESRGRLNCLRANSDLKSLNTMSKLQKAKSTNTYLMAASSDAPYRPLLFPNSAKIFGISWDMQVLGSLSKNFSPLFSIFQHYVDVDVSEASPLQATSTSLFDIEKICYCDFMYFGDLRFGGKDSHTSLYIILQVSKALTSALPLPSCFLWLQVWFAVSRYKSQIFKVLENLSPCSPDRFGMLSDHRLFKKRPGWLSSRSWLTLL